MIGPRLTIGDGLGDGVRMPLSTDAIGLGVALGLGLDVALTDGLGVGVTDGTTDGLTEGTGVAVALTEGLGVGVAVTVADGAGLGSAVVGVRFGRKYTYANDATAKAATTGAAMSV